MVTSALAVKMPNFVNIIFVISTVTITFFAIFYIRAGKMGIFVLFQITIVFALAFNPLQ